MSSPEQNENFPIRKQFPYPIADISNVATLCQWQHALHPRRYYCHGDQSHVASIVQYLVHLAVFATLAAPLMSHYWYGVIDDLMASATLVAHLPQ